MNASGHTKASTKKIYANGDESAETMYLKDGVNGFVVQRGNLHEMDQKLLLLVDNDEIRQQFSAAAKKEIEENGNVEKVFVGFIDALNYATGSTN